MPTRIVYDAEGWGVGELWLEGATGTVLWHELPSPSIRDQVTTCYLELVERLRAYFAGEDVSFEDVPGDLRGHGWPPLTCVSRRQTADGR